MDNSRFTHIRKVLARNKKLYLEYNEFRKKMFRELSPETGEIILYLLPWLLSINDPACPGYVEAIDRIFRVYGIEDSQEIRAREDAFRKMFSVRDGAVLQNPDAEHYLIEGLYTIGSVGAASQTPGSDCDIWVCFNKKDFNRKAWEQINQKLNLIKDWMDTHLNMPVYFFISDVTEIRMNRFGSVDEESSGSAQQNTLKEEFYRTCIAICGKIPLWWLCFDQEQSVDYEQAAVMVADGDLMDGDLIDLGNLEKIDRSEYFGAALWQFQKSLLFPLKSIIKMALLETALNAPDDMLLCHRYREKIFTRKPGEPFPDTSLFTAGMIIESYARLGRTQLGAFIKECFYLKCDLRPDSSERTLKNRMADTFFKIQHPISNDKMQDLAAYDQWHFDRQIAFGESLFKHLLQIYAQIVEIGDKIVSKRVRRDLTILNRKISACYSRKPDKIAIVQKPFGHLNVDTFSLGLDEGIWKMYAGDERKQPLVSSQNIIFVIAFMVWNDFFSRSGVYMQPNHSNITIQEIKNLGEAIREMVGTYKTLDIDIENYLQEEHVARVLTISGFEKSPWSADENEYGAVYTNCWGELFVEQFDSLKDFQAFLKASHIKNSGITVGRYLRRSSTAYEKIIARAKHMQFPPG